MHIVEIYAHVMGKDELSVIVEKYKPSGVFPCRGYELML